MAAAPASIEPAADATITALAIPLFVTAGPVNGTAFAISRDPDGLYYLVDNAPVDGPPIWVHEGQVERCAVRP